VYSGSPFGALPDAVGDGAGTAGGTVALDVERGAVVAFDMPRVACAATEKGMLDDAAPDERSVSEAREHAQQPRAASIPNEARSILELPLAHRSECAVFHWDFFSSVGTCWPAGRLRILGSY